jgi:hypothetical protein
MSERTAAVILISIYFADTSFCCSLRSCRWDDDVDVMSACEIDSRCWHLLFDCDSPLHAALADRGLALYVRAPDSFRHLLKVYSRVSYIARQKHGWYTFPNLDILLSRTIRCNVSSDLSSSQWSAGLHNNKCVMQEAHSHAADSGCFLPAAGRTSARTTKRSLPLTRRFVRSARRSYRSTRRTSGRIIRIRMSFVTAATFSTRRSTIKSSARSTRRRDTNSDPWSCGDRRMQQRFSRGASVTTGRHAYTVRPSHTCSAMLAMMSVRRSSRRFVIRSHSSRVT